MDKEYIIQLIFNDQIEEAIQALLQLAAEKGDASLSLQLKRISAELAGIRSREATGIISPGESEAELIKIKQDLLAGLGVFTHWEPPLLQKPDETEFESWRGPSEAKTPSANITQSEKEASAPSERVVNTGFAENEKPIDDLPANRTLATGHKYFFWLEVGKIMEKSIEKNPTPLPTEHLPEEAELEVALYTLNDACSIDAGADVGKLKLTKNDTVEVLQQPQQPFQVQVSAEIAQKRLFFPLQTATHNARRSYLGTALFIVLYTDSRAPQTIPRTQTQRIVERVRSKFA